ncbi:DamX, an inner membrane protein involved in bile resistance [Cronobacter turicensis 564]|nr:DamX, an inner membrane protein involved in bile resistance [Cronobacter turicensis 564]
MDEFKPEDELKPDPSDRRTGRSRKSAEFDNEPQINIDDVDLDADDRRPSLGADARDLRSG